MRPPEEAIQSLALQWFAKAGADFDVAVHLMREGSRFREIVCFHAQQAAEKYLKALLVRRQVEFPKTHDIKDLLDLLDTVHPAAAEALRDAEFLTPFGVKIRYPGDFPDTLPDAGKKAVTLLAGSKRRSRRCWILISKRAQLSPYSAFCPVADSVFAESPLPSQSAAGAAEAISIRRSSKL